MPADVAFALVTLCVASKQGFGLAAAGLLVARSAQLGPSSRTLVAKDQAWHSSWGARCAQASYSGCLATALCEEVSWGFCAASLCCLLLCGGRPA
eukprot:184246-Amphidinium_carterae.1